MEHALFQVESIVVRVVSISHLSIVGYNGQCRIWDPHLPMEEEPNRSPVRNVKFSGDGSKLAVVRYSDQIEMWTKSNGECQWSKQINLHVNYEICLAFSTDDSKIVCKSGDKTIILDAESGEQCNSEDAFDFESIHDHVHYVDDVS